MLVCTIVARNYLAHARVLARSFRSHHPEGRVAVLVIDDRGATIDDTNEPFDVVRLADLPIDERDLHRMATMYDVLELSTAIKPWLLEHLLEQAEAVAYLDPDIEVFAPLDDIDALARQRGIVLTPHRLSPTPDDGRDIDDRVLLTAGARNLGFIAVSRAAAPFLTWWKRHLAIDCLAEPKESLFVDQHWVDLATTYFPHHQLDDPGCNIAYWNLDERALAAARFIHWSGYEPDAPWLLSKHQGVRPRILLSEQPELAAWADRYGTQLQAEGWATVITIPYGWATTDDGLKLDRIARRLARDHVREGIAALAAGRDAAPLPDPFTPDGAAAFTALLRSPHPDDDAPRVGRYLARLWSSRRDLRHTIPRLTGMDANHFLWWIREHGAAELDVPPQLVPDADALEPDVDAIRAPTTGVNAIGYFRGELGVGEAGRGLLAALAAAGEPTVVVTVDALGSRQRHDHGQAEGTPVHDVNLLCVNADRALVVFDALGRRNTWGRVNIGYWAWEVEGMPAWMAASAVPLEVLWSHSTHSARILAEALDRPVEAVPPALVPVAPSSRDRASLGLPDDDFLFLFCFDVRSVAERKNPWAVVEAFTRAFAPGDGPRLVIKAINGDAGGAVLERVRYLGRGRTDVHVLDGYLDPPDHQALMSAADAYVSLHRAEGFGLTMAEAMHAGKPVIATGWSGNLDFMDDTSALLVPFEKVAVPRGCEPYPVGARWADPDIDEAARMMRQLAADPAAAAALGSAGREMVRARLAPKVVGATLCTRLAEIRGR